MHVDEFELQLFFHLYYFHVYLLSFFFMPALNYIEGRVVSDIDWHCSALTERITAACHLACVVLRNRVLEIALYTF